MNCIILYHFFVKWFGKILKKYSRLNYGNVKSEAACLHRDTLKLRIVIKEQNAALFEIDFIGNISGCDGEIECGKAHIVKTAVSAVFGEGHDARNGTLAHECDDVRLVYVKGKDIVSHSVFAHGFLVGDFHAVTVKGHGTHAGDADVFLIGVLALAAHDVCENFKFDLLFLFHGNMYLCQKMIVERQHAAVRQ